MFTGHICNAAYICNSAYTYFEVHERIWVESVCLLVYCFTALLVYWPHVCTLFTGHMRARERAFAREGEGARAKARARARARERNTHTHTHTFTPPYKSCTHLGFIVGVLDVKHQPV